MKTPVTVLGLGTMGTALARAFLAAGHPTTVWNRTPGRSPELDDQGAVRAEDRGRRCRCQSAGRRVPARRHHRSRYSRPASTSPAAGGQPHQRHPRAGSASASGRARRARTYVDGGIMAVPAMIGGPAAFILYSGSTRLLRAVPGRPRRTGSSDVRRHGRRAGGAPRLALLSAMYGMFGGVAHALAMVSSEKLSVVAFTDQLLVPWLTAMLGSVPRHRARSRARRQSRVRRDPTSRCRQRRPQPDRRRGGPRRRPDGAAADG